ncbi:MAG: paraslipin [Spirochaetaceae bacterium]|nr:MAG: paraslipin [Spirochaetaceae bacterium]
MGIFSAYGMTLGAILLVFLVFFKLIRIVPEAEAWIVEEFGKFKRTLGPGFHLVVPFVQRVAYQSHLKEEAVDVEPQVCITQDNVQVTVDGVLYLMVVDAEKAAYGIENYRFATAQLAQTTMRSEIGKIGLDNTFSERDRINDAVVKAVDEASDPWGIKVTRYEIKDITPTETVMVAMEQQVRAEREKRAEILASEGERESRVNRSKGERQQAINLSQGERQKRVNEADGKAQAISIVAEATAEGIGDVAKALQHPRGKQAVSLRIAEQFISQLGEILNTAETQVLPYDIAQIRGVLDGVLGNRGSSRDSDSSLPPTGPTGKGGRS